MDQNLHFEGIIQSVASAQFKTTSKAAAEKFLKHISLNKENYERFLSWMIYLDVIPEDSSLWPQTLYYLVVFYDERRQFYSQNSNSVLDQKNIKKIEDDVKRAKQWFEDLARIFGLSDKIISVERIVRVLSFLMRESPQFNYLQGYDRFAIVSYLISYSFCQKINCGSEIYLISEAFAISLVRKLIQFSDISSFLTNSDDIQKFYSTFDAAFKIKNEQKILTLSKVNITSINFVTPWIGVLFADNHDGNHLTLLWDHFILHYRQFNSYFLAIANAHLSQVPYNEQPYDMMENIQNFRDWDVIKIIKDAEKDIEDPIISRTSITGILRFWI